MGTRGRRVEVDDVGELLQLILVVSKGVRWRGTRRRRIEVEDVE